MNDEILEYIKSKGPCTPIDIARKLGINSMVASAVASDLVGNGISQSKRPAGSQLLYYTQSQAGKARERLFGSMSPNEQKFLKALQTKKVILEGEIPEIRLQEFGDFLEEFDFGDKKAWKWFEVSSNDALETLKKMTGQKEELLEVEVPVEKAKEHVKDEKKEPAAKEAPKPKEEGAKVIGGAIYADKVSVWLEGQGAKVGEIEELKKDKYWTFTATLPTPLGTQKYLIIAIKEKKRQVGSKDIKAAFESAVKEKLPVIMVSSTGFAKAAEKEWSKNYRNMLSLVDGKTL